MKRQFDFEILQRVARDKFIHLLECIHNDKILIIDSKLMKPLDRLLNINLLRQHGVVKIFRFEEFDCSLMFNADMQHVFLIRPNLAYAKKIVHMFNGNYENGRLIFVPRKLSLIDYVLEELGVFGLLHCDEFDWSFIPLETDLISLELPEYFTSTFIENTNCWFYSLAQAMWHFQSLFGPFPAQIFCAGQSATVLANMIESISLDQGYSKLKDPCCSHVILIDRDVDPATMFLSSLTYESLLEEKFTIQSGFMEIPEEISSKGAVTKVLLTGANSIYASIRDEHFAHVFSVLKKETERLQGNFAKRNQCNLTQLKEFIRDELKDLRLQHRTLTLHIGLSEAIVAEKNQQDFEKLLEIEQCILSCIDLNRCVEFLRDYMAQRLSAVNAFSLLCLLSLVQNGLPAKDYSILRREFLQAYGFQHLSTFFILHKMRLCFRKESFLPTSLLSFAHSDNDEATFQSVTKKFNLIRMEKMDLAKPGCASYVFNGAYIPLACRLVDQIAHHGACREFQRLVQVKERRFVASSQKENEKKRKTILVVFLGGVTRAEIAGLRLIGKLRNCDVCIATTHILSKKSLLKAINEF
ncbi:Sec1 family protein [Trichinella nativa]|uniref:Sec1 family protein n=1 Tax=Trichinella nativa TaxID=6335 RepID=A0A1Y3ED35_9BILA|nr:Vacuolar protein sorting-associated protein 33B [Trichinella sp. T6]OUC41549.1 Sec1 family protein [Trichinella nativa]